MRQKSWSPYLVGALIGILSWVALAVSGHLLGITTAFEYSAALLLRGIAPAAYETSGYAGALAAEGKSPRIDWEWMLVAGVFLGAWLSSKLSGDRGHPAVPRLWSSRFGDSRGLRFAAAFLGGGLMMLGARIAQGCTSGHGISGNLQLAVSSGIFSVAFFVTGVVVARALFAGEASHVR